MRRRKGEGALKAAESLLLPGAGHGSVRGPGWFGEEKLDKAPLSGIRIPGHAVGVLQRYAYSSFMASLSLATVPAKSHPPEQV